MRPNLTLITLGVSDFDRSVKFYRDGLGFPMSPESQNDVAFFTLKGIVLGLFPREKLAEDAAVSADGSGFSGITLAYNATSEQEMDEVLAQAEKIGAKITKKGQKVFWGGYNGYFTDPDGHLWEVAYNPFWKLDEEGKVVLE